MYAFCIMGHKEWQRMHCVLIWGEVLSMMIIMTKLLHMYMYII